MPFRRQTRTEDCLVLDSRLLRLAKRQAAGTVHHDGAAGVVAFAFDAPFRIRVAYQIDGLRAACAVDLLRDEPNFGGVRWWFSCPECGSRRRKLYVSPGCLRLGCRNCRGLAYRSQLLDPIWRARDTAIDIRVQLGGTASLTASFPPRPRGMWRRTYWRRLGAAGAAEAKFWRLFAQRFACSNTEEVSKLITEAASMDLTFPGVVELLRKRESLQSEIADCVSSLRSFGITV